MFGFLKRFKRQAPVPNHSEGSKSTAKSASPPQPKGPNYEDLKRAVMKAMWPLPYINPVAGINEADQPALDRAREKTQRWRDWATNEPSLDRQTRRAYLSWVEHCEWQNEKAQEEITYGPRQKSYEAYLARRRQEDARTATITVIKPTQRP